MGICKEGTKLCNPTGVGYGPCSNQVLPKVGELCTTVEDDDCNGEANEGCICVPQSQATCYTGPQGTEDVGVCKGGYKVCEYTGKAYGSCITEVVPGVENCASAADESCDGETPPCTGSHGWSKGAGGGLDEAGLAVTTDAAGNVLWGGYATSTMDVGCGPLGGGAAAGGWVAKLDAAGSCLWNKRFGEGSRVSGVAADLAGNVILTGTFTGSVDFGGGVLTSAGLGDVFFVKLDPTGAHLWSRRFGDAGAQVAGSVAVDDASSPVGVGAFTGSIDFGGGPLTSAGGDDIYVVKLNPLGTLVWAKSYGSAGDQAGRSVALDPSYNVLVTGAFTGSVDFGGGALTSAGLNDAFLLKLDSSGNHQWSKAFGDALDQGGYAVGADRLGNVTFTGGVEGSIDFGGAPHSTLGGQDGFVASFTDVGAYRWSRALGGGNAQVGAAVAMDPFGNVAVGVALQGAADLGGGALVSAGAVDVAVGKYDPAGVHLWSKRFGGAGNDAPKAMAFSPSGALLLTGVLGGAVDLGGGAVGGAGGEDAFLVALLP